MYENVLDGPIDVEPAGFLPRLEQEHLLADVLVGIRLGAWDRRIVTWLAGWDFPTVMTVVSLFARARGATGESWPSPRRGESLEPSGPPVP